MNSSEPLSQPPLPPETGILLKRLQKQWQILNQSQAAWDPKTFTSSLDALNTDFSALAATWPAQHQTLQAALGHTQALLQSDDYPAALEAALQGAGIPLKGAFPSYEFPPFKLTISVEQGLARLGMGRQSKQTKTLAPKLLSSWIHKIYQRTIGSKFNSERFYKELLGAYEMLSRLPGGDEVAWGNPVSLKAIYQLFTLHHTARQEYPEALFTYDLARLREQVDMAYAGHRFELVPTRKLGLLLVDSQGRESRVDSLAIYAREETDDAAVG